MKQENQNPETVTIQTVDIHQETISTSNSNDDLNQDPNLNPQPSRIRRLGSAIGGAFSAVGGLIVKAVVGVKDLAVFMVKLPFRVIAWPFKKVAGLFASRSNSTSEVTTPENEQRVSVDAANAEVNNEPQPGIIRRFFNAIGGAVSAVGRGLFAIVYVPGWFKTKEVKEAEKQINAENDTIAKLEKQKEAAQEEELSLEEKAQKAAALANQKQAELEEQARLAERAELERKAALQNQSELTGQAQNQDQIALQKEEERKLLEAAAKQAEAEKLAALQNKNTLEAQAAIEAGKAQQKEQVLETIVRNSQKTLEEQQQALQTQNVLTGQLKDANQEIVNIIETEEDILNAQKEQAKNDGTLSAAEIAHFGGRTGSASPDKSEGSNTSKQSLGESSVLQKVLNPSGNSLITTAHTTESKKKKGTLSQMAANVSSVLPSNPLKKKEGSPAKPSMRPGSGSN